MIIRVPSFKKILLMLASRNSRFGSMERRKLSDVILIYRVSKRPGSFRNRSKGGSTVRVENLPTNETGNRVTDEYYSTLLCPWQFCFELRITPNLDKYTPRAGYDKIL